MLTETQMLAATVLSIVYVSAPNAKGTSVATFADGHTARHTAKFLRQRFDEQGIFCLNVHQPPFVMGGAS